ncbi:hypothetical protein FA95DRAFT_1605127, partial [Auriscalpium vulgare]
MRLSVAFVTLAAAGACTPAFAAPIAASSDSSRRTFTEELFHGDILDGLTPPPALGRRKIIGDAAHGFIDLGPILDGLPPPPSLAARDVESSGDIGEFLAQIQREHPHELIGRGFEDSLAALQQALHASGAALFPSKRAFSDVVNFVKDHLETLALRDVEERHSDIHSVEASPFAPSPLESAELPFKRDFSDVANFVKDHLEVLALRD